MTRTAAAAPDLRAIPRFPRVPDAPRVEEPLLAESLPELYRQVLDRVATLESNGLRDEAGLVRNDAIRIYSGAWTESAARLGRPGGLPRGFGRDLDGPDAARLDRRHRPSPDLGPSARRVSLRGRLPRRDGHDGLGPARQPRPDRPDPAGVRGRLLEPGAR